jgi:hypothetical protein
MLTILCWGGIGDTLRNIGLVPHAWIYRTFGYRCRVVHRNWRDCGCLPHAGAPELEFFKDLIERIPSLEWRGESGEHRGLSRLLNRGVRDLLTLVHRGLPRYYPYEIRLTPEERAAIPAKQPGLSIGIQTHLMGMKTKRWGTANWRRVLELILNEYPVSQIHLLDTAPEVETLCFDPRIRSTRGMNIAQSMVLCQQLDLLVSVESWAKYIAATYRIPQVLIVPDMRSEYGGSTADRLSKVEYIGILGRPENRWIGLGGTPGKRTLTLANIGDLTPEALFAEMAISIKNAEVDQGRRK